MLDSNISRQLFGPALELKRSKMIGEPPQSGSNWQNVRLYETDPTIPFGGLVTQIEFGDGALYPPSERRSHE